MSTRTTGDTESGGGLAVTSHLGRGDSQRKYSLSSLLPSFTSQCLVCDRLAPSSCPHHLDGAVCKLTQLSGLLQASAALVLFG